MHENECLKCPDYLRQIAVIKRDLNGKTHALNRACTDNQILKVQIEKIIKNGNDMLQPSQDILLLKKRIDLLSKTNDNLVKHNNQLQMAKNKSANVCASCNESIKQLYNQVIQSDFFRTNSDMEIGMEFNHNMETVYKKYLKLESALERERKWSQEINANYTNVLSVADELKAENNELKSKVELLEIKLKELTEAQFYSDIVSPAIDIRKEKPTKTKQIDFIDNIKKSQFFKQNKKSIMKIKKFLLQFPNTTDHGFSKLDANEILSTMNGTKKQKKNSTKTHRICWSSESVKSSDMSNDKQCDVDDNSGDDRSRIQDKSIPIDGQYLKGDSNGSGVMPNAESRKTKSRIAIVNEKSDIGVRDCDPIQKERNLSDSDSSDTDLLFPGNSKLKKNSQVTKKRSSTNRKMSTITQGNVIHDDGNTGNTQICRERHLSDSDGSSDLDNGVDTKRRDGRKPSSSPINQISHRNVDIDVNSTKESEIENGANRYVKEDKSTDLKKRSNIRKRVHDKKSSEGVIHKKAKVVGNIISREFIDSSDSDSELPVTETENDRTSNSPMESQESAIVEQQLANEKVSIAETSTGNLQQTNDSVGKDVDGDHDDLGFNFDGNFTTAGIIPFLGNIDIIDKINGQLGGAHNTAQLDDNGNISCEIDNGDSIFDFDNNFSIANIIPPGNLEHLDTATETGAVAISNRKAKSPSPVDNDEQIFDFSGNYSITNIISDCNMEFIESLTVGPDQLNNLTSTTDHKLVDFNSNPSMCNITHGEHIELIDSVSRSSHLPDGTATANDISAELNSQLQDDDSPVFDFNCNPSITDIISCRNIEFIESLNITNQSDDDIIDQSNCTDNIDTNNKDDSILQNNDSNLDEDFPGFDFNINSSISNIISSGNIDYIESLSGVSQQPNELQKCPELNDESDSIHKDYPVSQFNENKSKNNDQLFDFSNNSSISNIISRSNIEFIDSLSASQQSNNPPMSIEENMNKSNCALPNIPRHPLKNLRKHINERDAINKDDPISQSRKNIEMIGNEIAIERNYQSQDNENEIENPVFDFSNNISFSNIISGRNIEFIDSLNVDKQSNDDFIDQSNFDVTNNYRCPPTELRIGASENNVTNKDNSVSQSAENYTENDEQLFDFSSNSSISNIISCGTIDFIDSLSGSQQLNNPPMSTVRVIDESNCSVPNLLRTPPSTELRLNSKERDSTNKNIPITQSTKNHSVYYNSCENTDLVVNENNRFQNNESPVFDFNNNPSIANIISRGNIEFIESLNMVNQSNDDIVDQSNFTMPNDRRSLPVPDRREFSDESETITDTDNDCLLFDFSRNNSISDTISSVFHQSTESITTHTDGFINTNSETIENHEENDFPVFDFSSNFSIADIIPVGKFEFLNTINAVQNNEETEVPGAVSQGGGNGNLSISNTTALSDRYISTVDSTKKADFSQLKEFEIAHGSKKDNRHMRDRSNKLLRKILLKGWSVDKSFADSNFSVTSFAHFDVFCESFFQLISSMVSQTQIANIEQFHDRTNQIIYKFFSCLSCDQTSALVRFHSRFEVHLMRLLICQKNLNYIRIMLSVIFNFHRFMNMAQLSETIIIDLLEHSRIPVGTIISAIDLNSIDYFDTNISKFQINILICFLKSLLHYEMAYRAEEGFEYLLSASGKQFWKIEVSGNPKATMISYLKAQLARNPDSLHLINILYSIVLNRCPH